MAFALLSRPSQQLVKLDPNPARPQTDGFNYPTFRLLNKQSRVTLSPETLVPSNVRKVFATASANGGWFAATTSNGLIVSSLAKLRDTFKSGSDTVFTPERTLPYNPVAIAFACNDTRLLAGTGQGEILIFDTAQLFSSSAQVDPIQIFRASSSPPMQIVPNPSNENELAQLVTILRADGTVQMLDTQLEPKGSWAGSDHESTPVAVSWSPKGKQLAIGLRSGDILTFGLTNNAAPLKHIPATANSPLVSLHWLGPAFTFRTSYGSSSGDPPHHLVSLDSRSNTAAFIQLTHPFSLPDRTQNSQLLVLPRWDQDATTSSSEETKSLVVVGDTSSTDIEVLGNAGSRWFQQSQENQLTVPLDKNDDDTFLLALDADLTDEIPIMYAYLNDGTLQGWYITHPDSKQYAGLVGAAQTAPTDPPAFAPQTSGSAFGQQQPQPPTTSAFGQSSTPAFGQPSAFGQSSSPFGQPQITSAFGQVGFGQKPAFGQSSFASQSPSPTPFGAANSGSAFGTPATGSFASSTSGGFGSFASSTSAFGATNNSPPTAPPMSHTPSVSMGEESAPSFGGLSLGGSTTDSDKSKAVGGGMFGAFGGSPSPANQSTTPAPSSFSDPNIKPAAGFGAFGGATGGAFSNPKPASAFGTGNAFAGGAFGGGSSDPAKPASQSNASPAFGKPAFGQAGFGFGQAGFGQAPATTFGQSGFGTSGAATGGGFGSFASSGPSGFGSAGATSSPSSSGGFSSFASATPSAFGKPATASPFGGGSGGVFGGGGSSSTTSPNPADPAKAPIPAPTNPFGQAAGSATPSTPASAFSNFGTPGGSFFGNKSQSTGGQGSASPLASAPSSPVTAFGGFKAPAGSLFGNKNEPPASKAEEKSASSSPEGPGDRRTASPNDSPPPAPAQPSFTTSTSPMTTGAFGNLKSSPSGFKPSAGFGAFGNSNAAASSPFFNAPAQTKDTPVSAFTKSPSDSVTAFPAATAGKPAFGSTSMLGGTKSAFGTAPTPSSTPPASSTVANAFSAFSNSSVSFTSPSTPGKSFADLLKVGDDKSQVSSTESPKQAFSPAAAFPSTTPTSTPTAKRAPVFTPPPKDVDSVTTPTQKGSRPIESPQTDNEKEGIASGESSFGSLSLTSQTSSFVDVTEGDEDEGADDEDPGDDDFLSESYGSGSEAPPDDEDGEDDYSRSPSPAAVPLPPSRSPSSTPHAEPVNPHSEDEESDSSETSRLSTIREESATPPGSPEKKEQPSSAKAPLAAPAPVAPPPFGIGLGRPSTRPTRSSPLAAAPLSGDEEDKPPTPVEQTVLRARPASPKPLFGTLPGPVKTEDQPTPKPARPKTPPFSALSFGSSAHKPPTAETMPLAPPQLPAFPGFPKASSPATPVSSAPSTPTPAATKPVNFFGLSKPAFPTPVPTPSPPISAPKGFFGLQPAAQNPKLQPALPVAPPPEVKMEDGMQKECALLFANITRELEDFRALAQAANQKRMELNKSAGGSRRTADLGNPAKWGLVDAVQFSQTLRLYEQDLEDLREERGKWEKFVRELQSNLLKAGTRKEEIGRFLKAQHDKDFAKMLKARTLGPEHLETQTHLRRSIRAIQDRIQKLESHLQESKKRLSRAGNPGLRAPTLDTLNRTFRNMDIALDNQTNDVEKLTARVSKLNIAQPQSNGRTAGARDARLPDPISRQRPFSVTPHVAVTTAAALNAERSAHKLKRALLAVRKEPLLNNQAASAPPAPVAFKTPQRAAVGIDLGLSTPMRGFSLGLSAMSPSTPPQSMALGFDFPEDNFNPSPPPPVKRGAGGGGKSRISPSVQLRRSPGQPPLSATPPPTFDWGPLPSFGKPKSLSPENSLSGSWVSDGFRSNS